MSLSMEVEEVLEEFLLDEELHNDSVAPRETDAQEQGTDRVKSRRTGAPYRCRVCDESFPRRKAYRRHMRCHEPQEKFVCAVCTRWFATKKLLRVHKSEHTSQVQYYCDHCVKRFTTKTSLALHLRTHAARFECAKCSKRFPTRRRLDKHALGHRPGHLRHVCHVCFHTFPSKYHLERHLVIHRREGISTEYDATKMLSTFQRNAYFQRSFADAGDDRPARDRLAGPPGAPEVLVGGDAWAAHGEMHRNEGAAEDGRDLHKCEVCAKVFKQSYYLKLHTRTHTGERPYECKLCEKRFTTSSKLSRHMQTHSGVKLHRCTTCNKSFSRPSYMRIHMSRHVNKFCTTVEKVETELVE